MPGFVRVLACGGALLAGAAAAQEFNEPLPFGPCAPAQGCGGWIVGADYLYLKACSLGGDYAYATNGPPTAGGAFEIRELGLQPRRDPAFRASFGRRDADGYDVLLRWLNFHAGAADAATPTGGQALLGSRLRPQLQPVAASHAEAAVALNVNAVDLERGLSLEIDDRLLCRFFGGVRYANLRRSFDTRFTVPSFGFAGAFEESSTLDAVGPRFGFDAEYRLHGAWGWYAKGAAGLLAGRVSTTTVEAASATTRFLTRRAEDRIVPTMEFAAGLSYRKGPWRIVGGYEIQHWFGATGGTRFLDSGASAIPEFRDLSLRGYMVRAEIGF